jgi:hypothetical protein
LVELAGKDPDDKLHGEESGRYLAIKRSAKTGKITVSIRLSREETGIRRGIRQPRRVPIL